MKTISLMLIFIFNIFYSQESKIDEFIMHENFALKIKNISKFIDKSSTIYLNDYKNQPILIHIRGDQLGRNNENILNGIIQVSIIGLDNYKLDKLENYKCYRINEDKYILVDPYKFPKEGIINNFDSLKYDCSKVLPKVIEKKKFALPQSSFKFFIYDYGVFLYEVASFDSLEYLNIEFLTQYGSAATSNSF